MFAEEDKYVSYTYISDKHITVRPTETCMNSRKGSPEYWVAIVKLKKILYEIGGIP